MIVAPTPELCETTDATNVEAAFMTMAAEIKNRMASTPSAAKVCKIGAIPRRKALQRLELIS
jgi:hypothetical protein